MLASNEKLAQNPDISDESIEDLLDDLDHPQAMATRMAQKTRSFGITPNMGKLAERVTNQEHHPPYRPPLNNKTTIIVLWARRYLQK